MRVYNKILDHFDPSMRLYHYYSNLANGWVSAGYLWHPQVREWLFFASAEKENKVLSADTDDKKIVDTMESFHNEILIANQTTSSCFVKLNNKLDETKMQMQDKEKKVSNPAISIEMVGAKNDKLNSWPWKCVK